MAEKINEIIPSRLVSSMQCRVLRRLGLANQVVTLESLEEFKFGITLGSLQEFKFANSPLKRSLEAF